LLIKTEHEVQSWVFVAGQLYLTPTSDVTEFWRIKMKSIALAAAISLAASTAFAGGLEPAPAEPMVEPMVEAASGSSANGLLVPLLALILIGAAVAANNN
jgi:hypothetical protein